MENTTSEKLVARVGIFGDTHLCDRDYGQHNDYPTESLEYFQTIMNIVRDKFLTHVILTGDFSYGRFKDLSYRIKVDNVLDRLNEMLGGNLYMVKGNHDTASNTMTEYEYYLERGKFHPSTRLHLGKTEFLMVDYDKEYSKEAIPSTIPGMKTIVVAHNWFVFEGQQVPPSAKVINLTNHPYWFNIEGVISGHIHQNSLVQGFIKKVDPETGRVVDGGGTRKIFAWQLPCWARPQYLSTGNPDAGEFAIAEVYESRIQLYNEAIQLWPHEKSFNLSLIEQKQDKKEIHETHKVDLTDIVNNLTNFSIGYGNPEDMIMGMLDVDIRYRKKAVELLKGN